VPSGVCPKRWRTTTLINHVDAYPVDAAKRDWDKGALNRVWVGDIERHEALLNRAVMKGHRLWLVAASRKKLRAA